MFSLRKIKRYYTLKQTNQNLKNNKNNNETDDDDTNQLFMMMDGKTIYNLEIFENNNSSRGTEGTLWNFLDHCKTAFGKRLLRRWINCPLYRVEDIDSRLSSVSDLISCANNNSLITEIQKELKTLPDLERMITRIHYQRIKIVDFLNVLNGFLKIYKMLKEKFGVEGKEKSEILQDLKSERLIGIVTIGKLFPKQIKHFLKDFETKIDKTLSKEMGMIIPKTEGLDEEYDEIKSKVTQTEQNLNQYLKEKSKKINKKLQFGTVGKDEYLIEIQMNEEEQKKFKKPKSWIEKSKTKTKIRFHTVKILKYLEELNNFRDELNGVVSNLFLKLTEKFDENLNYWVSAVECIAELDALISLSIVSSRDNMSKPVIHSSSKNSNLNFLHLKDVWHPCIYDRLLDKGETFVPNHIFLGTKHLQRQEQEEVSEKVVEEEEEEGEEDLDEQILREERKIQRGKIQQNRTSTNTKLKKPLTTVLTGPNMGGKSTLLRQICIVAIMAQIGCYVPASQCEMTVVDRIFTRIGANDYIIGGQSTFMVELLETAAILNCATKRSLVIMDELGRGTSTYDGYAIALAVVKHITETIKCRMMFSTHYHLLVKELEDKKKEDGEEGEKQGEYRMEHMGIDVKEGGKEVVFLYKLTEGSCPGSYGMNVARMAGIRDDIIEEASKIAERFVQSEEKIQEEKMEQDVQEEEKEQNNMKEEMEEEEVKGTEFKLEEKEKNVVAKIDSVLSSGGQTTMKKYIELVSNWEELNKKSQD